MEWLNQMNDAVRYLEANLTDDIDYAAAAKAACCSLSRFQRMFSFAADMSPAEYVRRRRMTLAAEDLLRGDVRILYLAHRYRYESPEAFTRAFQAFHGVSPTALRKRGTAKGEPPLLFKAGVSGGNVSLGARPLVRMEDHSGERVVSFWVNCRGPEEAAGNLLREWAVRNLRDYTARRCVGCAPRGHHPEGEAHRPNEEAGCHEYVMEMFLLGEEGRGDTFLGAQVRDAPRGLFLVGDVALNEFHDDGTIDIGSSMQTAFGVMGQCLERLGGVEFDLEARRHREEQIFADEWWSNPTLGDAGLAGFRLWLPVRRVKDKGPE